MKERKTYSKAPSTNGYSGKAKSSKGETREGGDLRTLQSTALYIQNGFYIYCLPLSQCETQTGLAGTIQQQIKSKSRVPRDELMHH